MHLTSESLCSSLNSLQVVIRWQSFMVDQIGKEVQDIAREVGLLASRDKTEHRPGICAFVQVPGDTINAWRRNWAAMTNRLCTSKSSGAIS